MDPRIVDGIELISGTYSSLLVQYQEMRKDLVNVSQLTLKNQALLGSLIGGASSSKDTHSNALYHLTEKDMEETFRASLLKRRLVQLDLHVNHGKVLFVRPSLLIGTLDTDSLTPRLRSTHTFWAC